MSLLLLAPLLLLHPLQDAAPDDGWIPIDGVAFQAGDKAITHGEIWMHFDAVRRKLNLSVTNEEQQLDFLNQSLQALVTIALEAQAGEDRDEDPASLEDKISKFLKNRREGTPAMDYAASLEQAGLSMQSERELNRTSYYRSSFQSQGKVGPRPTRDGYVRPGELKEFYRSSALPLLGGPSSYRFQDLVVRVAQVGGVDECRALAEELHARLEAGDDFGEIHDKYGTTEQATRGVTEMFGPDNPMNDPDIARFGERGKVGDVSPVLTVNDPRDPEKIAGFRVLRLYEKIPGTPAPPFETAKAQDDLRKWAEDRRDEAWLAAARARLQRTAYLWPKPAEKPVEAAPVPPAGADQPAADGAPDGSATGSEPAAPPEPGSTPERRER